MKKIIAYIFVFVALGYIVGCTDFEDYQSSDVLPQPTATLSVSAVADSSFIVDIATDKAGILGYAVLSDTSVSVAAISILSQSISGGANTVATQTMDLTAAGSASLQMSGLMPNTYYKVAVAASNTDGVESMVKSMIVKTDDGVGPSLSTISPSSSQTVQQPAGFSVVLSFDEPIGTVDTSEFSFVYYIEGVEAPAGTVEIDPENNRNVIVTQSHNALAGDYVFLSYGDEAVADLSGNPIAGLSSGVVEGSPVGLYWLVESINFSVTDYSIVPNNGSVIAEHDFAVELNFPFAIELEELTADMVKFKYEGWLGTVSTEVAAGANCEIINDTTLRITQPKMPNHGDKISLYLAEGVISDSYDNVNSSSEYELSWTLGDFTIPGNITPASGSIVASQLFNVYVDFDFSISVVPDVASDAITMTYVDSDGIENTYNVDSYGIDAENDSVLVIQTPQTIDFGSTVILNIKENVVQDEEGNVNLEMQDLVYWEVPKLAESIDVLLGQYIVSGVSYYDNPMVSDTVTIELKEGTTNTVLISGIFSGLLGGSETVEGVYDEMNSLLSIPEQVIGTAENRIYTAFSNMNADYAINAYVLEDGTMNTDLALGVYDGSFAWLGLGEYLPEVTWSKISSNKSAKLKTNESFKVNTTLKIHNAAKGIR